MWLRGKKGLVSVASHRCPILVKTFNRKITWKMFANGFYTFVSPYGIKKCVWECWYHNSKFLLSSSLPDEIHTQKALKYELTVKTPVAQATRFTITLLGNLTMYDSRFTSCWEQKKTQVTLHNHKTEHKSKELLKEKCHRIYLMVSFSFCIQT